MAFDATITEQEMDQASQSFVQGLRGDSHEIEPDLSVDGLKDSLLSKFLRLIGVV